MNSNNLHHSPEGQKRRPRSPEIPGSRSNQVPVKLGRALTGIMACAALGGVPDKAEAAEDLPSCDVSTLTDGLPAGADDTSVNELYVSVNDTDGINTYYCAVRDIDGDWYGNEYACWDGSAWQSVDFSGTSLDGSTGRDSIGVARIIDGSLYVYYSGAYQETGSGLDWNDGEIDLSSESVGGTGYFTYDPYTTHFYRGGANPTDPSHYAIMDASDDTYAFIENADLGSGYSDFHLYDAASCGDGNLFINGRDGLHGDFRNFVYNFDSGEIAEIDGLDGMVAPACDYDGASTTTLFVTDYDSGTPYQITCTHDGGTTTYTYYDDIDSDGYGDASAAAETGTSVPTGHSEDNTDCNDTNASVNPGATEVCDGVDNNCDGATDEGLLNTYYRDLDRDGYGNPYDSTEDCSVPSGFVDNNTDCDDSSNTNYPGATELCDGEDNDCNDVVDNDVKNINWYSDTDRDGYGDSSAEPVLDCADLSDLGYSTNNQDCNDSDADMNPDATERVGDDTDNNCDGLTDGEDPDAVFYDTEGNCEETSNVIKTSYDGTIRARVNMLAADTDCVITFYDGGSEATIYNQGGGGELIYDCTNGPDDCYNIFIPDTDENGTDLHFESNGAHNTFVGVDQFWVTVSGSGYDMDNYRNDGAVFSDGEVTSPTIMANYYPGADAELLHPEDLEEVAVLEEAGDTFFAEQNSQGVTIQANDEQVYPEEVDTGDDTGTQPDDTAQPDTSNPDTGTEPPGGCPGCAQLDSPEGAMNGVKTAALLVLAGFFRRKGGNKNSGSEKKSA